MAYEITQPGVSLGFQPAAQPTGQQFFKLPFNELATALGSAQQQYDVNTQTADKFKEELVKLQYTPKDKQLKETITGELNSSIERITDTYPDMRKATGDLLKVKRKIAEHYSPGGDAYDVQHRYDMSQEYIKEVRERTDISSNTKDGLIAGAFLEDKGARYIDPVTGQLVKNTSFNGKTPTKEVNGNERSSTYAKEITEQSIKNGEFRINEKGELVASNLGKFIFDKQKGYMVKEEEETVERTKERIYALTSTKLAQDNEFLQSELQNQYVRNLGKNFSVEDTKEFGADIKKAFDKDFEKIKATEEYKNNPQQTFNALYNGYDLKNRIDGYSRNAAETYYKENISRNEEMHMPSKEWLEEYGGSGKSDSGLPPGVAQQRSVSNQIPNMVAMKDKDEADKKTITDATAQLAKATPEQQPELQKKIELAQDQIEERRNLRDVMESQFYETKEGKQFTSDKQPVPNPTVQQVIYKKDTDKINQILEDTYNTMRTSQNVEEPKGFFEIVNSMFAAGPMGTGVANKLGKNVINGTELNRDIFIKQAKENLKKEGLPIPWDQELGYYLNQTNKVQPFKEAKEKAINEWLTKTGGLSKVEYLLTGEKMKPIIASVGDDFERGLFSEPKDYPMTDVQTNKPLDDKDKITGKYEFLSYGAADDYQAEGEYVKLRKITPQGDGEKPLSQIVKVYNTEPDSKLGNIFDRLRQPFGIVGEKANQMRRYEKVPSSTDGVNLQTYINTTDEGFVSTNPILKVVPPTIAGQGGDPTYTMTLGDKTNQKTLTVGDVISKRPIEVAKLELQSQYNIYYKDSPIEHQEELTKRLLDQPYQFANKSEAIELGSLVDRKLYGKPEQQTEEIDASSKQTFTTTPSKEGNVSLSSLGITLTPGMKLDPSSKLEIDANIAPIVQMMPIKTVNSAYRPSTHPLSKKNPSSLHIDSLAIDVPLKQGYDINKWILNNKEDIIKKYGYEVYGQFEPKKNHYHVEFKPIETTK